MVGVQRVADRFEHVGADGGRQQRLAGGDDAHLAQPFALQRGTFGVHQVAPGLLEEALHGAHQACGQQAAQVRLGQAEQQRLLWRETGDGQTGRLLAPAVAVGLAAVVALDVEVAAEHVELPLHGAQVAFDAGAAQLSVQFRRADFAMARDAAQQFDGEHRGFKGVGALGHGRLEFCMARCRTDA